MGIDDGMNSAMHAAVAAANDDPVATIDLIETRKLRSDGRGPTTECLTFSSPPPSSPGGAAN
jgi:hypothetical protein